MSQGLNVAKKHIVEYACSGWFSGYDGQEHLHNVLSALSVGYTSQTESPEYERDFEVERKDMERALNDLKSINEGKEVEDIDTEDLTETLEKANITLAECIDCFEWLLTKSDNTNSKEWIYISFF